MELKKLSSNWKKLQQTLQADTVTRKRRASAEPGHPGSPKRVKRGTKMGYTPSKPQELPDTTSPATSSRDNLTRAKSTTTPQALVDNHNLLRFTDKINAGLTPGLNPGKYIAIDCEMVGVGPNPDEESSLARVSIVDFQGAQVYDSFVAQKEAVTDFRTHVSGITPKLLKDARTLEEVQKTVSDLLKGRILVGHAVKHDLEVLMLGHPKMDIRDTSRHPRFRALASGRTPALRKLAKQILGIEIQAGQHSSVEDARTTMALFRMEKDAFEIEHKKRWGGRGSKTTDHAEAGSEKDNSYDNGDANENGTSQRTLARKRKKKKGKRK